MRYWILKGSRNSQFDYKNDFPSMVVRDEVGTWISSKLLHVVQPGDRLFVYEGSPRFEVWGLACYARRTGTKTFKILYETDALDPRVQRDRDGIADEPLFADATFLKAGSVQTLYALTEEQARWLYHAVLRRTPEIRGTWPDLDPAPASDGEEAITRAISIRQPYVELILRGEKREEYRSRPTNVRERVWIYASLTPADDPKAWTQVGVSPADLPAGGIVGSVEIIDCHWNGTHYAYTLREPRRLARPREVQNQPQPVFWKPRFRTA
jgi:hypothetical protein